MRVFVACSAKETIDKKYSDASIEVATLLAKRGNKLLFGGIDRGMMGKVFYTFKYEGAKTKAVAQVKDAPNLEYLEVDASAVTGTTFERTKKLYEGCELAIFLPGGIGTFAELFSIIDEARVTGSNNILLYNFDGFFDDLILYLRKLYNINFISESDLKLINVVSDIKGLEKYLDELEEK